MKKLIISMLSACMLLPTLANAEVYDLICTFDREYLPIQKLAKKKGLYLGRDRLMKEKTVFKYKFEMNDGNIRVWDAFDECNVTPTLRKENRILSVRISSSKKESMLSGTFNETIVSIYGPEEDNPALNLFSAQSDTDSRLLASVTGGSCKMIPHKE